MSIEKSINKQKNGIEHGIDALPLLLPRYSKSYLISICDRLNIPYKPTERKKDLIQLIITQYYNVKKHIFYTFITQLGREGKDGRTFLATDKRNQQVAIKVFKSHVSENDILKEVELQKKAARKGIAPQIIDYCPHGKYIVMDTLEHTLYDSFKSQNGVLTKQQQQHVIRLFRDLDQAGVFHGDPNPLNIMYKEGRWYMIDFGFAEPINSNTIQKYGSTPNMTYMPIGLYLKLKHIYNKCSVSYIERYC